jgi:xanthine dehydrogenase accessory factor
MSCDLLEQGESFVLATIINQLGSAPRMAGAKMIVTSDGRIVDTIGGGLLEAEVMKAAADVLDTSGTQIRTFDLGGVKVDSMDMICGGEVEILLESIDTTASNLNLFKRLYNIIQEGGKGCLVTCLGTRGKTERCIVLGGGAVEGDFSFPASWLERIKNEAAGLRSAILCTIEDQRFFVEPIFATGTVYIFGAGHVSQQVAHLTSMTHFRTVVLDDRAEFANVERFPEADEIKVPASLSEAFTDLEVGRDSYIVIVTRGHRHDKTVLKQALRTEAVYIGMIGSKGKRDAVYKALLDEGVSRMDLERVHSPIGLKIGGDTPEEIAVSIVAELVKERFARNHL